ncbi:MAG: (deoxy)nucleoside triphosphate pyrophosphohydrolase [Spirochaetia bacterium]|jgi:mutator protein MutT|nr:(deoxy)nucleoside triphosphate pyrophosphohydrolase [Spirochaetia bacterium]
MRDKQARLTTAGIFRSDKLFLLAKRRPGGSIGGCWEFPGGKVEAGESPEEALRREIREELGAEISVGALFVSFAFSNNGKDFLLKAFEARLETPIRKPGVHEEIRWLTLDEAEALDMADSDRKIHAELKKTNH